MNEKRKQDLLQLHARRFDGIARFTNTDFATHRRTKINAIVTSLSLLACLQTGGIMMHPISIFMLALSIAAFENAALTSSAHAIEPVAFHTPSKNIYCYGFVDNATTTIDCELLSKTNDKPVRPRPNNCEQEWGNRFALGALGKAQMICSGDTLRSGQAKVLPYGNRLDYYGIACTASKQGLECINDDAHGFFISKSTQKMY